MKRLLSTACIVLGALFAMHAPATAGPPPRDISAEIAELRPAIASAKLYHATDGLSTNHARTEKSVARGCYYAITGDDLAALLDLLTTAQLTQYQPSPYGFEAHIVIYLTTRDNTTIPLVFSDTFSTAPVQGSYDHTVPIEADNIGFGTALHDWMAHRTETAPTPQTTCKTIL